MHAVSTFTRAATPETEIAGTGLAFGFLLLVAFFGGRFFKSIRLPRLTGYIAAGIVAGDQVLHLVTHEMVESLSLVNGVAVCLIALTAGGELNLKRVRPLLKTIAHTTIWAVVGTALVLGVVVFAMRDWLPFLRGRDLAQVAAICGLLGVTLSAQSPAVVTALLTETQSDGPLSRTILALVVIADLVVIVLFTLFSSVCQAALGQGADVGQVVRSVAWELLGSMGVGTAIGLVLWLYIRRVERGAALFVLLLCAVVAEVARRIHLDSLIVMLAAGMFVENVGKDVGSKLIHDIEGASLPVFAVFFALAGAHLRIDLLIASIVPAAIIVGSRGLGFFVGGRIGTALGNAEPVVRRYAWMGLVPQAGLAIALATLMERTFPSFGAQAGALVLGVIGCNEIVAPVFLRFALVRSGEAGKRGTREFATKSIPPPAPAQSAPSALPGGS
ncbi:MAG: cation:proton antiporter [Deltaproteobacteria bacterium]|nr:cation:proton antiporter [Deltaproteobacteria bacterium]